MCGDTSPARSPGAELGPRHVLGREFAELHDVQRAYIPAAATAEGGASLRPGACMWARYRPYLGRASRAYLGYISRVSQASKGDKNPKDFIVFTARDFACARGCVKDNTGDVRFEEGIVFPTLRFPSDHAVISASLDPA